MSLGDRLAAVKVAAGEKTRAEREARAEENRRTMPTVTAWVDEIRELFGDDCKVAYASEGGRTIGQKSPPGISLAETCPHGRCEKMKKSVDDDNSCDMIRPVPQRNHRRKK